MTSLLLLFATPYTLNVYCFGERVIDINYVSVKIVSEKWGKSKQYVQKLCEDNHMEDAERFDLV